MKQYINDNWRFTEEFTEELIQNLCDETKMTAVRLPHNCKEVPLHYFDEQSYQMLCGYQRMIYAKTEWKGKAVILTFDGIGHDAVVYLNGEEVGSHHCGYTAFSMDISKKEAG